MLKYCPFLIIILGVSTFMPYAAAQETPSFINALPSLPGADPSQIQNFPGFIIYVINFAFWIIGLVLFGAFLYAGIIWLTAAGNMGKISKAKEVLTNAILGFILLLSSWLILNVINPDLTKTGINLPYIPEESPNELQSQKIIIKNENGIALIGIPEEEKAYNYFINRASAQVGIYSFTIMVTDANRFETSETFTVEVKMPGSTSYNKSIKFLNANIAKAKTVLSINPVSLPNLIIGQPYFQKITVSGGSPPYNWTIIGRLPTGITIHGISQITSAPPALTPTPTKTPTTPTPLGPTPTPKICPPAGNFPSTCSSGYTFLDDEVYTCFINDNCLFDEECSDLGLSCYLQSSGGCECSVAGLGPCCQKDNPLYYASKETADALADCLGAEVKVTYFAGGPWVAINKKTREIAQMYTLKFENGAVFNAGLVANTYNKYPKNYADRMIQDMLKTSCP